MTTLTIRHTKKLPINDIVDFVFEHAPAVPDSVEKFEIIEGASSLFGAGDNAAIEIVIRYKVSDLTDEILSQIERILTFARESADEIEILSRD